MLILNYRYYLLLAAVACITGCGKQERADAVQFAKALNASKAGFAGANATEKDMVSSARAWCGGITANGAGKGAALDQNAAVALALAKSAVAISTQLSQVRQAIDDQPLKDEYPRGVRNTMTTQLTKRQRILQDVRTWLEQSAPQFLDYKNSKAYAGDTYPDGIGKLDALLRSYAAPDDAVGGALTALKSKYNLSDNEF